jgi:hypothetical protein
VFDWLFDGCLPVSLVIGAAGVGLLFAWYRTSQYAFGLGGIIFIALLVIFIAGCFIYGETAREQIERKVQEMVKGVDQKDVNKIFNHVSDRFEYTQGTSKLNKQELRNYATDALRRPELRGMIASQISVDPIDRDAGKALARFMVNVLGENDARALFNVEAEFTLDPDKQWRMKSFKLHQGIGDQRDQISLPIR